MAVKEDDEVQPTARERCRARAIEHLRNFVMSYSYTQEMAAEYATALDEAQMLLEQASSKFPKRRMFHSRASPVISTYTGPGLLVVSVLGDDILAITLRFMEVRYEHSAS